VNVGEAKSALDAAENRLAHLSQVGALLHYDRSTKMPKAGMEHRARSMSLVASEAHTILTDAALARAIRTLKDEKLPKKDARRVERFDRTVSHARKLPAEHVRAIADLTARAEHEWEEAKRTSDFARFEPYLAELVKLKKAEARFIDAKKAPYDVLIDEFEEGMTQERIESTFARIRERLVPLLDRIRSSERFSEKSTLPERFGIDGQRAFCERITRTILGDGENWLLEESVHPFTTTINPSDVRITTAYRSDNLSSISATIHEAGHALYELGFKRAFSTSILGEAPSYGIHESQSRFWENHVGISYPFWQHAYRQLRSDIPELNGMRLERFYRELNRVEPSLIRIYADEVTYPLHIIIRFEIERALFSGSLSVKDVPEAWNRLYHDYLGITPPDDAHGCLQDVHWSMGAFGYFPSYLIGTVYAAQISERMERDIGYRSAVREGAFDDIRTWLDKRIHRYGQLMLADDTIKRATGAGLDSDAFIRYLEEKYAKLYGI
jgi:carboxypeptidase Taq